jgi:hypothetical protein
MTKKTEIVTLHSVGFRGIFGRNRSVKFTSSGATEAHLTTVGFDVRKLAGDFARSISAKRGDLRVTRYDDCERTDHGDGVTTVTIPIGVVVYTETL